MNDRIQEIRDRKSEVVDFAMPGSTYEQLGSDIDYLLSEVERLQTENDRLMKEAAFWNQATDNQRDNNYLLLKDRAIMKDAFDAIGDILTDDTSTKAIEINQTINLALSHLKG